MKFTSVPDANVNGTSFHGITINCSFKELVSKLGKPHCMGDYEDKVRYEWFFVNGDGKPVTLYDWKSYCDSPRVWNVGGLNKSDTVMFREWFNSL